MTRVPPLAQDEVDPLLRDAMEKQRSHLGLVPESLLTMAHRPRMAAAWATLTAEVVGEGEVSGSLKQLVAYIASTAHGCRYCQAHTAHSAHRLGVPLEKLENAWEFETSDLFSDAERVALALARDAAQVPNQVTDAHFEALKKCYTTEQIVEIMGVIAMFGWLNRWNDSMATTLEATPRTWASEKLGKTGWEVGRHATSDA
jgi:uncharacterized peroxidase-related enzyme